MLSPAGVYFSQSQPMIKTSNEPFSVCYKDQSRVVSPTSPDMSISIARNINYEVAHTPALLMSIWQTSIWIWTFSYQRGWIVGEYYARQF